MPLLPTFSLLLHQRTIVSSPTFEVQVERRTLLRPPTLGTHDGDCGRHVPSVSGAGLTSVKQRVLHCPPRPDSILGDCFIPILGRRKVSSAPCKDVTIPNPHTQKRTSCINLSPQDTQYIFYGYPVGVSCDIRNCLFCPTEMVVYLWYGVVGITLCT